MLLNKKTKHLQMSNIKRTKKKNIKKNKSYNWSLQKKLINKEA